MEALSYLVCKFTEDLFGFHSAGFQDSKKWTDGFSIFAIQKATNILRVEQTCPVFDLSSLSQVSSVKWN